MDERRGYLRSFESAQAIKTTNRFTSGVTYDLAGNVTTDNKFTLRQYTYDANNRQKTVIRTDGAGGLYASVYDGAGQRVATINNGLTSYLVYDVMGKVIAEYGQAAAGSGGVQYVFTDRQGSTRVVTTNTGVVTSRHDYEPFGQELGAGIGMRTAAQFYDSADAVRQKYAGMEEDEGSGMSHTLWRQYDSLSGRWTAPDPYGGSMTVADPQSFNRYSYVSNDPVNLVDPSGLMLSDIGVYQTENPEVASILENAMVQLIRQYMGGSGSQSQAQGGNDSPYKTDPGSHTVTKKGTETQKEKDPDDPVPDNDPNKSYKTLEVCILCPLLTINGNESYKNPAGGASILLDKSAANFFSVVSSGAAGKEITFAPDTTFSVNPLSGGGFEVAVSNPITITVPLPSIIPDVHIRITSVRFSAKGEVISVDANRPWAGAVKSNLNEALKRGLGERRSFVGTIAGFIIDRVAGKSTGTGLRLFLSGRPDHSRLKK